MSAMCGIEMIRPGLQPSWISETVTQGVAPLEGAAMNVVVAHVRSANGTTMDATQVRSANGTTMDATQVRSANGAALGQPGATPQEYCPPSRQGLKARPNRAKIRPGLQPSWISETVTLRYLGAGALPLTKIIPPRLPEGKKAK